MKQVANVTVPRGASAYRQRRVHQGHLRKGREKRDCIE